MNDHYQPLYVTLLGDDWSKLDARLQRFHSGTEERRASGILQVRRGAGKLARFLAWLFRMPQEGRNVPVRLVIRDGGVDSIEFSYIEIWERRFADQNFTSFQFGDPNGRLIERISGLELWLRLEAANGALVYVPQGGALALGPWQIKLPRGLAPMVSGKVAVSKAYSSILDVSVSVTVPISGLVLAYEGYIEPEVTAA